MEREQPRSFAALLRRYRLAACLTQEQLAERAGLTAQAVSTLERGFRRLPHRETVRALGRALALPPADLAALEAAVGRSRGDWPPARGAERPALPTPPTPLIGREREAAEVAALLHPAHGEPARDPARLLTLTGPGGVGKTRLALQVARAAAARYADGAVFVDLAPLRESARVAATIAQALRVEARGDQAVGAALRLHLRDRHLLLLLDNFEQVAAAAPLVADLLAACPRLQVLATSRAGLRVRGEHLYVVPPLPVPDAERPPPLAELARVPAVALLVQRAQAAAPAFALHERNATAVAALCARLEGLPLALELAAARLSVLAPDLLLRRLTPRLGLLTEGARDLPERQHTLRATLDWSHALLGPDAQAVFRRLSVFAGGCTLEAAEAVCRAGQGAPPDVVAGLGALVDQSLLRHAAADGADEGRFALLETVREYGLERLEEAGEAPGARRAHLAYFLALADQAAPHLGGPSATAWLDRLAGEHENLSAALATARAESDAEGVLRLAGALGPYWERRGRLAEGRRWLEDAVAQAGSAPAGVLAAALQALGHLALWQHDAAPARAWSEQSLALYRRLGDRRGQAQVLKDLGNAADRVNEWERAAGLYEQSLALSRALRDELASAILLNNLGNVHRHQGAYARAEVLYRESAAHFERLCDAPHLALVQSNLGLVAAAQGAYGRAVALLEQSLAEARTHGFPAEVADRLNRLAEAAYAQGDLAACEERARECLELYRLLGDRLNVAASRLHLARLVWRRGDPQAGAAQLRQVLGVARGIGARWGEATVLLDLGQIRLECGRPAQAQALCRAALRVARGIGHRVSIARALEVLGWVLCSREREQGAREAALLLGAADALRASMGVVLPPIDRDGHVRALAAGRAAAGAGAWERAWFAGQALPLEQAIERAAPPNEAAAR